MFEGQFQSGPEHADRRIAHQEIQPAELLAHGREDLRNQLRFADVGLNGLRPPAQLPDGRADRLRLLMAVVINDGHVTAGSGQLQGDRPADAPRSTRNQRYLA